MEHIGPLKPKCARNEVAETFMMSFIMPEIGPKPNNKYYKIIDNRGALTSQTDQPWNDQPLRSKL